VAEGGMFFEFQLQTGVGKCPMFKEFDEHHFQKHIEDMRSSPYTHLWLLFFTQQQFQPPSMNKKL
jgi:hypothetical protein